MFATSGDWAFCGWLIDVARLHDRIKYVTKYIMSESKVVFIAVN